MIKLRHLTEDDLEKVLNWRTSEHVTKYMFSDIEYNLDKQKEWLYKNKTDPNKQTWMIVYNDFDIGVISLSDIDLINKRCFFGYYVGEISMRGKGLARHLLCNIQDYVFDNLQMNKLCGDIFAFNEIALKVRKKYGSEIEGVFKQHIYKNGQFHDVLRMAILKEKWLSIREEYNYEQINIESFEQIGEK